MLSSDHDGDLIFSDDDQTQKGVNFNRQLYSPSNGQKKSDKLIIVSAPTLDIIESPDFKQPTPDDSHSIKGELTSEESNHKIPGGSINSMVSPKQIQLSI